MSLNGAGIPGLDLAVKQAIEAAEGRVAERWPADIATMVDRGYRALKDVESRSNDLVDWREKEVARVTEVVRQIEEDMQGVVAKHEESLGNEVNKLNRLIAMAGRIVSRIGAVKSTEAADASPAEAAAEPGEEPDAPAPSEGEPGESTGEDAGAAVAAAGEPDDKTPEGSDEEPKT